MIYHLNSLCSPPNPDWNTDKLSTICSQGSCTVAQTFSKKTTTKKHFPHCSICCSHISLARSITHLHMNNVLQQYGMTGNQKTTFRTCQLRNSTCVSLHTCVGTLKIFRSAVFSRNTSDLMCSHMKLPIHSHKEAFHWICSANSQYWDVWISSFNSLYNDEVPLN